MGPFDDQLILDLPETVTLNVLSGGSATITGVNIQETGVQQVIAGTVELVSRDYRVSIGKTQRTTRPTEGSTITRDASHGGTVLQIVAVLEMALAHFWLITGRSFAVPGGLTEVGTLKRRNSTPQTTKGLSDPNWTTLESSVACKLVYDAQEHDFSGETNVDTLITGRVLMEGFREIRAGDRWTRSSEPTVIWDVDGAEPYDVSLGVQILRVSKR